MDDRNPADVLPELYRAILDAVARLDGIGERAAAYELRSRATRVYSTQWNERGRDRLERILRESERRLAASPKTAALDLIAATA